MRQRNYTSKMTRGFYVSLVFAFIPAILANIPSVDEKAGFELKTSYNICLTETNVTDNDIYTIEDILYDRYKQSENQEKLRKNACFFNCVQQKEGFIKGSEFNAEKLHAEINKRRNAQPGNDLHKATDDCIEKAKDIADICAKSFSFVTCYFKAEEILYRKEYGHEHEHEQ